MIGQLSIWVMGAYVLILIGIGILGKKAKKNNSLSDFYLAGRNISFFVLFLTLFATQYSGNTMIGFPGKAYRSGFTFLVSVPFMMSVIAIYFLYIPKLFPIAKKHQFITPSDYIHYRFKSRILTSLCSVIFITALCNFMLSNLIAMGHIVEGMTGGDIPFSAGVISLAIVMVFYETLGGMRSVAWTDVLQGLILLSGCLAIFIAIFQMYDGITNIGLQLKSTAPEMGAHPGWFGIRQWLSTLIMIACGIAIYPHAIQRVYAAKNVITLRRSLQLMLMMPLLTTLLMIFIGWIGIIEFPSLSPIKSDEITLFMLKKIAIEVAAIKWMIILFICASVAAIMSTVDSALLSLSSIITQDFYAWIFPCKKEFQLVKFGKILSWILMSMMVILAIVLPQTIWKIIEIKLELLIQVFPALFLGLHNKDLKSTALIYGVTTGSIITVILLVLDMRPFGIHAGVWGLILNLVLVIATHLLMNQFKKMG